MDLNLEWWSDFNFVTEYMELSAEDVFSCLDDVADFPEMVEFYPRAAETIRDVLKAQKAEIQGEDAFASF